MLPAFIDIQFWRIRRMVYRRTMTVFTLDDRMNGHHDALVFVRMAVIAVVRALILDLELFPIIYSAFPVPSVHVTPLMNTKILWHIKELHDKK